MKSKPKFIECGCCECLHRADYYGDCRNDAERFNVEDLEKKYGVFGFEIIPEE